MRLYVWNFVESRTGRYRRQEGATIVEYSLLLLFIAVVCFAAATLVSGSITGLYEVAASV